MTKISNKINPTNPTTYNQNLSAAARPHAPMDARRYPQLMSTAAQIAANQMNAQRSTGPQTVEGKSAAAQNNFRHGLRGKFSILPTEDPQDFTSLFEGLREEHRPATLTEQLLVDRMAEHEWLSRRAQFLMDRALTVKGTDDEKALGLWLRYQATHDRGFHKCLAQLLKLRNEKRKEQIGFERQKHQEAEQIRKEQMAEARTRALHAQASLKEFDVKIRAMLEAPLPGNTPIDFARIKPFLNQALEDYFRVESLEGRSGHSSHQAA